MSSFIWGMKACPIPRNSYATVWKLRQPLFLHQIRIVLLSALHSEIQLGSAGIPLHFGLLLCNPSEQSSLQYIMWKRTQIPFIWGIVAWSAPSGYKNIASVSLLNAPPSYIFLPPNPTSHFVILLPKCLKFLHLSTCNFFILSYGKLYLDYKEVISCVVC